MCPQSRFLADSRPLCRILCILHLPANLKRFFLSFRVGLNVSGGTHHVVDLWHVSDDVTDTDERNVVGDGLAKFRVSLILRSKRE